MSRGVLGYLLGSAEVATCEADGRPRSRTPRGFGASRSRPSASPSQTPFPDKTDHNLFLGENSLQINRHFRFMKAIQTSCGQFWGRGRGDGVGRGGDIAGTHALGIRRHGRETGPDAATTANTSKRGPVGRASHGFLAQQGSIRAGRATIGTYVVTMRISCCLKRYVNKLFVVLLYAGWTVPPWAPGADDRATLPM